MRIVFFGTSDFAVPALRAVSKHVVLVVSQPDRPHGRGLKLSPSPVKQCALELGIPVETPEKARDAEFIAQIQALDADFLLVASYGQILSVKLLESSKRGAINLHGSILPEYRGAAPIQRAILDGKTETGVTLMQMDKGMDTGDMIAIERMPITPDATAGDIFVELADLAGRMVGDWAGRITSGDYPRVPQDNDLATYAPKIEKAEAELSFERDAATEYNRFRAFTPAPGAFLNTKFGPLKISGAKFGDGNGTPGSVVSTSNGLEIAFLHGSILFELLQPAGKKAMDGKDFANGFRIRPGDDLRSEQ
jgi:methionyl-tRNA formyltransferase